MMTKIAIILIILGILPFALPTTYFRYSPLGAAACAEQNDRIKAQTCEVCGEKADTQVMKRYQATRDVSGSYVGYDPREWPGNAAILVCDRHASYAGCCAGGRLTLSALLSLLFNGNNVWLRIVVWMHAGLLVVGVLLLLPFLMKEANARKE